MVRSSTDGAMEKYGTQFVVDAAHFDEAVEFCKSTFGAVLMGRHGKPTRCAELMLGGSRVILCEVSAVSDANPGESRGILLATGVVESTVFDDPYGFKWVVIPREPAVQINCAICNTRPHHLPALCSKMEEMNNLNMNEFDADRLVKLRGCQFETLNLDITSKKLSNLNKKFDNAGEKGRKAYYCRIVYYSACETTLNDLVSLMRRICGILRGVIVSLCTEDRWNSGDRVQAIYLLAKHQMDSLFVLLPTPQNWTEELPIKLISNLVDSVALLLSFVLAARSSVLRTSPPPPEERDMAALIQQEVLFWKTVKPKPGGGIN